MNPCHWLEPCLDHYGRALLIGCVAFALALILARLGLAGGWIDHDGGDPELRARKPRRQPVPLVGGLALLGTLFFASLTQTGERSWPWAALLAAFALGTLDDLLPRGLNWRAKLGLQALVAALLAWHGDFNWPWRCLIFVVAVCAQNAANTFDNSDGALLSLTSLAWRKDPVLLGATLGLLPLNLCPRRAQERVPYLYLGDAGSHMIGVLWAMDSTTWPVLILPLADLARLSWVRFCLGRKPWQGDRRHLAHRFAALGLAPSWVALLLLGVALPALLAPASALGLALGTLATLGALGIAVRLTPTPEEQISAE